MGTLVVVRHAQASLFADDYDVLSDLGGRQAQALGGFFVRDKVQFDSGFAGPARRHRDTAALAGESMREAAAPWPEIVTVPDLDEHDGLALMKAVVPKMSAADPEFRALVQPLEQAEDPAVRSQAFQRVFERVMKAWLEDRTDAPRVESWFAFRDRVRRGFEHVFERVGRGSNAIVFTSVGPIAVLLQRALSVEPPVAFRTAWRLRNCSLSTFVFNDSKVTLDRFNELPHLARGQVTFR